MLTATCHCGAVRIEAPRRPRSLTECNCSICRRYGALWAYYDARQVRVIAAAGALGEYCWGDKSLKFQRCRDCGCVTHYLQIGASHDGKMAINARMFDPDIMGSVRIRHFDGAVTWRYLD